MSATQTNPSETSGATTGDKASNPMVNESKESKKAAPPSSPSNETGTEKSGKTTSGKGTEKRRRSGGGSGRSRQNGGRRQGRRGNRRNGRKSFDPSTFVKSKPVFDRKVKELSPNDISKPVNLVVRVVKSPQIVVNRTYLTEATLQVAIAMVGDSTGIIALNLRNAQVSSVKKGDVLILRNALLRMSPGHNKIFLRVDEWGLIEKVDPRQFDDEVDEKHNVSEIEWEKIVVN